MPARFFTDALDSFIPAIYNQHIKYDAVPAAL